MFGVGARVLRSVRDFAQVGFFPHHKHWGKPEYMLRNANLPSGGSFDVGTVALNLFDGTNPAAQMGIGLWPSESREGH